LPGVSQSIVPLSLQLTPAPSNTPLANSSVGSASATRVSADGSVSSGTVTDALASETSGVSGTTGWAVAPDPAQSHDVVKSQPRPVNFVALSSGSLSAALVGAV